MKTWVRKTLSVGVLAAGALLFGPTAAHAADLGSVDSSGIANGLQVVAPVQAPVNLCGTGIGIGGTGAGAGSCTAGGDLGGAATISPVAMATEDGGAAALGSGGNAGVANGAQVYAPVQVPINICGTGLGLLGDGAARGDCSSGAAGAAGGASMASGENTGVANGAQVYAPVQVPINICGTGLGLAGDGAGRGDCSTGAAAGAAAMTAGENDGALNGAQIAIPVQVPVNVCGTGLGLAGDGEGKGTCDNGGGGVSDEQPGYGSQRTLLNKVAKNQSHRFGALKNGAVKNIAGKHFLAGLPIG